MCHKQQKSPTAETVGDSHLDIKSYPNVTPSVDSALLAESIHVRFCFFRGHKEGGKQ